MKARRNSRANPKIYMRGWKWVGTLINIVCEVPAKPQWCEIRTTVFSWTATRFPLHIRSTRKLTLSQAPIITVVGKAFWDIGHAPQRSIKQEESPARVRDMGNSSGDEGRGDPKLKLVVGTFSVITSAHEKLLSYPQFGLCYSSDMPAIRLSVARDLQSLCA
jgi:hypothetical protein